MPPEEKEAVVLSAPTPPVETDEFAAAFADLSAPAPVEKPAVAVEPSAPAAPVAPESAAAPAVPAAPAEPSTPAAPVVPESAAAPAASTPPDGYVSAADFAALKAQIDEMKRSPPVAAPTPAPAPEATPVYSTDETAILNKYKEDWPDVAAGEALARRQEYHGLVKYIFDQINPLLTPLLVTTDSIASRTQLQDLEALIPDYHQVRAPVIEWVDKQPEYLKEAFTKVTSTGTPDQIADLVTRFKKDTGWVAPAAAAAAAAAATPAAAAVTPPVVKAAALPAAAAAAAAALKPVKTSRSEAAGTVDPNDFDAAFKEAISAV